MSRYVRKSSIYCKDCGAKLVKNQRNYCNDCLLNYYHRTNSRGAYTTLVRRGYGGMLMLEYLAGRGHKIQRQDKPAPPDKENKDE